MRDTRDFKSSKKLRWWQMLIMTTTDKTGVIRIRHRLVSSTVKCSLRFVYKLLSLYRTDW